MKQILSALVENRSGVLARISGLFARRGFNIDSLAVGETEDPTISRMTIVVDGDDSVVEQVEKQLNKLVDVIKVAVGAQKRGEVIDIARVMDAKIVDISATTLTIELCDRPERVTLMTDLLSPYKVREVARTGTVALEKGAGDINYRP